MNKTNKIINGIKITIFLLINLIINPSNAQNLSQTLKEIYFISSFSSSLFKVTQNQNINLSDSITNRYSLINPYKNLNYFGIGLGKHFNLNFLGHINIFDLNLSGYYIDYQRFSGIVHPAYNAAPDFDTLNYYFAGTSKLALLELRYFLDDSNYKPYVYLSAGPSVNNFSQYYEQPTFIDETAAPMPIPFFGHQKISTSYGIGVGMKHVLINNFYWAFEYRFLNAGKGKLGLTPEQSTSNAIRFNYLNMHSLVLSLYVN